MASSPSHMALSMTSKVHSQAEKHCESRIRWPDAIQGIQSSSCSDHYLQPVLPALVQQESERQQFWCALKLLVRTIGNLDFGAP